MIKKLETNDNTAPDKSGDKSKREMFRAKVSR